MTDIERRIKDAEDKAAKFRRWVEEAQDEAIGAESCGMRDRAEQCHKAAERWQKSADVWAATAGKLTASREKASEANISAPIVADRDYQAPCSVCRAPAEVPCLGRGVYPEGWTAADEKHRSRQVDWYATDIGYRFKLEEEAQAIDFERSKALA